MKVIQVVKTNRGATWAYNQAKCLHSKGVDIVTVLPNDTSGHANLYKENGMRIITADWSLPISKPWRIIKRIKQIKKVVSDEKPDLLHLHFVTNVFMTRIALHNDKTTRLFQVPGPLHLENPVFRFLDKFLSTSVDYWAGACEKTCSIYRNIGISDDRVFLAYYGTFKDEFCKIESSRKLHEEYGLSENTKIVAMVSYFYKPKKYLGQKRGLKGHEDFIDALEKLLKVHPEVTPIIIGNAWDGSEKYEQEVIKYAESKLGEKIVFTGYRKDIQEIYPEIDVAVHPSHSENLGGAAESLAYAVPTISSNVGGFPDIIKPYQTGLLVNPKNPEELAKAIAKMIENPLEAKKMGENGKNLVRNLLNVKRTSNKIFEIYKTIVHGE
ncbi:TPA: glycosyltransferase family 4 protein [Enterococcus faecium]